eukprot:TRINITY_DN13238_c0_g1_i2.p1 TRINITY_DN13238_c0_g1~~TRINITY_DN13238_c0_g1_i2.p1  ORF type:complete len:705 (+),score=167.56 TRINITY_DN13238_c0_g1_i2:42-2156(+)
MDGDWVGRLLLPALAAAAEPGRPGTPATVQCLRRRRPVLNGLIRGLQSTSKTRTLSAATSSASHLLQVAWCAAVKTLSADPFQLESVVDAWRAVLSAGEHAVLSCNTPLDTVGLYSMLCFVAWIVATSAGTAPADGAMGVRTVLGAMQTDLVLWRELRLLFQQPVRLLAEERAMLDRLLKLEQTLFGTHGVDEDMSTAFSKLLGDQLPAVSAPARSALQAAHCEKPGLRGVGGSAVALWGDSFVLGGFGEVFVVDVDAGTTHSVSVHGPDDWPVHRGSAVVTVECSDDTMFVFQRSRRLTEWALTRRTGCPTATLTHVYAAGGRDDELSTHSRCRHIAVDSSSSTLFSIHERHAVAEWDLESQRCRSMLRTVHPALCLCVVKQLLVVGEEGVVQIFNFATGVLVREVWRPWRGCFWLVRHSDSAVVTVEGDRIYLWDRVLEAASGPTRHGQLLCAVPDQSWLESELCKVRQDAASLRLEHPQTGRWKSPKRGALAKDRGEWKGELEYLLKADALKPLLSPRTCGRFEVHPDPDVLAVGGMITAVCPGPGGALYVAEHTPWKVKGESGSVATVSRLDVTAAASAARARDAEAAAAGEQVKVPELRRVRTIPPITTTGCLAALHYRYEVVGIGTDGTVHKLYDGLLLAQDAAERGSSDTPRHADPTRTLDSPSSWSGGRSSPPLRPARDGAAATLAAALLAASAAV